MLSVDCSEVKMFPFIFLKGPEDVHESMRSISINSSNDLLPSMSSPIASSSSTVSKSKSSGSSSTTLHPHQHQHPHPHSLTSSSSMYADASSKEQAQERAQLVMHMPPTFPLKDSVSLSTYHAPNQTTLNGSLRARRATVESVAEGQSSEDENDRISQQSIIEEMSISSYSHSHSRKGGLEEASLVRISSPPSTSYSHSSSTSLPPSTTVLTSSDTSGINADTLIPPLSVSDSMSHSQKGFNIYDVSHDKENFDPLAAATLVPYSDNRLTQKQPTVDMSGYSSTGTRHDDGLQQRQSARPALMEVKRSTQQLLHASSSSSSRDTASLPLPQLLPELGKQHQQPSIRQSKLSSTSSGGGGTGYHPSDRQVLVNDYAVPTKRGGDTPPEHYPHYQIQHHHQHQQPRHQHQLQQDHNIDAVQSQPLQLQSQQQSISGNSTIPASIPLQQYHPDQQQHHVLPTSLSLPPVQATSKRTIGTVTVKGKTYTRMGLLGRGGSSKVFRVSDRDHQIFALKKVDLGKGADSETYQSFLNEIELLERLRGHDRIIQLVASEVNEAKKSLIMVMEIGEIDLNALLQEKLIITGNGKRRISMNFIRHTWEQMLEAVNVIHEEGIVHTDLKPANFVLVKGGLKLIDFGIAKAIPNDTTNIARDQQVGLSNSNCLFVFRYELN